MLATPHSRCNVLEMDFRKNLYRKNIYRRDARSVDDGKFNVKFLAGRYCDRRRALLRTGVRLCIGLVITGMEEKVSPIVGCIIYRSKNGRNKRGWQ